MATQEPTSRTFDFSLQPLQIRALGLDALLKRALYLPCLLCTFNLYMIC